MHLIISPASFLFSLGLAKSKDNYTNNFISFIQVIYKSFYILQLNINTTVCPIVIHNKGLLTGVLARGSVVQEPIGWLENVFIIE